MAEGGSVFLSTLDGGSRHLADIPSDPGDGATVAYEFQRLVQKAYEYGRQDQQALLENNLRDALAASRKGVAAN